MLDGWVSANHGDEGNADEQHHTPNLLPQAIGRKTPDKRNRSPSAMASVASRKEISSSPAIANIDEQLDEVVMDKKAKEIKHIFISENAMAQLSDDEQKRYLKILSENVVRANANYRLLKQGKN